MTVDKTRDHRPLILHVVYRFDVGGLENGVVNLINNLSVDRWQHGIVALDRVAPKFFARIQRTDVIHLSLNKAPGHAVRLYPRLFRLFRETRPAIVHTRNLAALEATVPAWVAGVRARVHGEHGRESHDPDGASRKYRLLRRAFSPFVTRYVTVSQDLRSYLQQGVGISADRITQIYNGVDSLRFAPSVQRASIPGCPFQDPDLWLTGTVGRMETVKDQTNLVEAFVRALRRSTEARQRMRLVLVGDGPLRAQAERIALDAGVADLVWFAGEREDIPDVLRGLDCFVLPSLGEGISNTILEAMASGLPVIATRVGGNGELVEDGVTGQLVPRANSESIAQSMLGYFSDPSRARTHGRAGRQRVEQRFSMQRMAAQYEELYLSALAEGGFMPRATANT